MKRFRLLLAAPLAAVLLLSGCATTSRVYLRPVEDSASRDFGETIYVRYKIPADDGALRIQIDSAGFAASRDGEPVVLAGFVFRVRNETGAEAILDVPAFELKDDEGGVHRAPFLDERNDRTPVPVSVAPGERGTFTVVFDVSGAIDPDRVGSVVLSWAARIGDASHATETKFVRWDVRARPYPYPYPSYYRSSYAYRHSRLYPQHPIVWVPYEPDWYDPYFDNPWFWDDF